jgi:UDP-2,4-diacetamido-2,4,6-trideoxy-beta-L-altropyranose hydrolase
LIFFKAEANSLVGAGHLQRSITIAKELELHGIKSAFIFADSPTASVNKVQGEGFQVYKIDKEVQYKISTYQKIIPPYSIIIFDTDDFNFYSGDLITGLKNSKIKTACFSISDEYYIETDLLLNPNIISKLLDYKCSPNTKQYLGPKFLIFRKEFMSIIPSLSKNDSTNNLLVIFGNADKNHLTLYFLDIINEISKLFNEIHIVVGILNPDIAEIKSIIARINNNKIVFHFDINNIIHLYEKTEYAITAAGMAMWEMALFKIPQMVVASSKRELPYTNYLHELKFIYKLGSYDDLPSKTETKNRIYEFLDSKFRELKLNEFNESIDPNGLKNIIKVFKQELKFTDLK